MTINRGLLRTILLIAAVACLAVAWFVSTGYTDSTWTNATPWGYAGLTLGFLSFVP